MEYKLVDAKAQGLPYSKVLDLSTPEVKTFGLDLVVKSGIVGQTYPGFENVELVFCPIEKTDTVDDIEAKIITSATNYIKATYPKTK